MKKILVAFGTRPEAIKLAPVIKELKRHDFEVTTLHTGQHTDLVKPMLKVFNLKPDINLNIMKPGQDLFDLTTSLPVKLKTLLEKLSPDGVIVQGDTTSAYLTALSAYYLQIPVMHVEAGLRSHKPYHPFPEELNRKLISQCTSLHFAPTSSNKENLLREGFKEEQIFITGNTVIDALQSIKNSDIYKESTPEFLKDLPADCDIVVLTAHRRENHGEPLTNIFGAAEALLEKHEQAEIFFPAHPNPEVQKALKQSGISHPRFHNITPLDYLSFLHLMDSASLILSDSGGIQEEAVAMGIPVLVLRNETERQELIDATSDFGIELDSICDMVSFGVAPGFLIYSFGLSELGFLGIIVSALPPLCGAVRLARFNVNARLSPTKNHFIGLPIPAQAIMLGAFFLTFRNNLDWFSGFEHGVSSVIIPIVVIISFLMVSTIPFDKIPRFDRKTIRERKGTFILFLFYLVLILMLQEYGLMLVFTIFVVKGMIMGAVQFFTDEWGEGMEEFQDYS